MVKGVWGEEGKGKEGGHEKNMENKERDSPGKGKEWGREEKEGKGE